LNQVLFVQHRARHSGTIAMQTRTKLSDGFEKREVPRLKRTG